MTGLKLLALDTDDLAVVSTYMQDAVFKVGDIAFLARSGQFSLAANRFVWENAADKGRSFERRRSALVFKRVLGVRTQGIDRKIADEVLSLLAIRFLPKGEGPEGTLEIALSGKATIALDVECVEVQLADVGGAWETGVKPSHPDAV